MTRSYCDWKFYVSTLAELFLGMQLGMFFDVINKSQ